MTKTPSPPAALAPGSTIGILGGGQLGRMLSLAAAQLGYRCCILDPDPEAPAADVSAAHIVADFLDQAALARFANAVDVVTYEFENVPVEATRRLERTVPVRPGIEALALAQDRLLEKDFVTSLGGQTAPFGVINEAADIVRHLEAFGGRKAILKTRRMGYDGKGQVLLNAAEQAQAAWTEIGQVPAVLEGFVDFDSEVSVLIARGADGTMAPYGPIHNVHTSGILHESRIPAPLSPGAAIDAVSLARRIATRLDYVGLLAVEMFVTGDGVVFNEMAPRVHNSGHWTIEGSVTSQFENHIRAICGLPLGNSMPTGNVLMRNLIGAEASQWPTLLADEDAHLHLYCKREARPGRKMGHVTWVRR